MSSQVFALYDLSLMFQAKPNKRFSQNNCNELPAFSSSRLFQYIFGHQIFCLTFYLPLITNIIPRRTDKVRGLYLVVNITIAFYKGLLMS